MSGILYEPAILASRRILSEDRGVNNNMRAILTGQQIRRAEDVGQVSALEAARNPRNPLINPGGKSAGQAYVENTEVGAAYPWHAKSSIHTTTSSASLGAANGYSTTYGGVSTQLSIAGEVGQKAPDAAVLSHMLAEKDDVIMTGTDPVEIINYPDETVKLDEPTALPALREGYENRLDLFRLFTDEGAVAVYAQAGADVAHLKEMTRLQLNLSPRLEIMLSPSNAGFLSQPLPDHAPIVDYSRTAATANHPARNGNVVHERHAPGGSFADDLMLTTRARPLSDFEVVAPTTPPPEQLRVRVCRGGVPYGPAVLVRGVQPLSTVNDVKKAVLAAPQLFTGIESVGGDRDKVAVYFSAVFFTPDVLLGRRMRSTLPGISTLAGAKLVKDDILYVEYQAGEAYHKPVW